MANGVVKILTLDCETDPFKHGRIPRPFLWGCFDGDGYYQCTHDDIAEMMCYISSQKCYVYAHNGGKFDYHYLFDFLEPQKVKIINGRIVEFKIGKATFRDSWNILPIPLAKYQKTVIDYAIFEPSERDKPANRQKIAAYLKDDCVFLHNLITRFVADYGINLTIAGASLKQWEKNFGGQRPRSDGDYYEQFAPFYYGGRVECFEKGVINQPFKAIDIRSAYPFAMLSKHPMSSTGWQIANKDTPTTYYAQCFFRVEAQSYGAFPLRDEKTRSISFPNDGIKREYFVTGHELIAARDTQTAINIKVKQQYIPSVIGSFEAYINHFSALRNEARDAGDKAQDIFTKLFQNNLYGKLAADPRHYHNYILSDDAADNGDEFEVCGNLGDLILKRRALSDHEMRFLNVATAASITGFVRAHLWRAICECDGVMYCDTDSIIARDISSIKIGDKLGDWEHDGDYISGAIAGKKLYAFKDAKNNTKIACKGVKLNYNEIVRIARGEIVNYKPEVPTYSLRKGPVFVNRNVKMT